MPPSFSSPSRAKYTIPAVGAVLVLALLLWFGYNTLRIKNNYQPSQLHPFLNATSWTLYSINPRRLYPGSDPEPGPEAMFQGFRVLGQYTTPPTPDVRSIVTDLDEAGRDWNGMIASCFDPRHGIRAQVGGQTYDLLICYECSSAEIYQGTTIVGTIFFAGGRASPEAFNALLSAAGIPIAKLRHEKTP